MKPDIEAYRDLVVFEKQILKRPEAWSPSQWLDYWYWIATHETDELNDHQKGYDIGYDEGYAAAQEDGSRKWK